MFFKQIEAMLGEGDTLVVMVNKGAGEALNLTITPKGAFKNANLGSGLSVSATAEELDRDLGTSLSRYAVARKTLAEQVEAAAVVLESAAKDVSNDTVKKLAAQGVKKEAQPAAKQTSVAAVDSDEDEASGGEPTGSAEVNLF